ncbi:MAG TPA: SPOR domain-containing protein [Hyphomicrobium sp.]|nr:SPOR domain-containing protein [Hyphomicrobium sp.]
MTRYNNPLPHTQAPPAQGRPAGSGHPHQPHPGHGHSQPHVEPELSGWPQPAAFRQTPLQAAPPQHRQAQPGYPDLGYPEQDAAAPQDPFAALRPDGYGTPQQPQGNPADPYGLAGYASPQPAPQGYAPPRQAPASQGPAAQRSQSHHAQYDPFAPPGEGYAPHAQPGGYSQPAFGNAASLQVNGYGAHARDAHGGAGQGYAQPPSSPGSSPQGYAGYASPGQGGGFGAADSHLSPQPLADQWGMEPDHAHAHAAAHSLALDAHDYQSQGGYGDAADQGQHAHWGAESYGEVPHDEAQLAHGHYQGQQQGTFDQSYADDDAMYEDEPRRAGWKKAAVLVACTVLLGGGLVYGVSGLFGPGSGEAPPLVKGAEGPSKVKPSEPGGKRFDHADSKIMGRLGEGAATADPSGVRKVPVVSVGRDGQIQPPSSERGTQAIVAVPGLTVIDGLGGPPGPGGAASPSAGQAPAGAPPSPDRRAAAAAPPQVEMVTGSSKAPPAEQRPAAEKNAAPAKAPSAPRADAPKKMAAADPSPAPSAPRSSGAGYVAVLASVPASASSRIDALTQFADMQQKYGAILSSKTPDIQEANLGAKGTYHRLLVGPPGSRDSANSVCNQLKAQGYNGCWITAY